MTGEPDPPRFSGKVLLRLDPRLHTRVVTAAKAAERSINSQLVDLITRGLVAPMTDEALPSDRPPQIRLRREAHETVKQVVAKTGLSYADVVNEIIIGRLRIKRGVDVAIGAEAIPVSARKPNNHSAIWHTSGTDPQSLPTP